MKTVEYNFFIREIRKAWRFFRSTRYPENRRYSYSWEHLFPKKGIRQYLSIKIKEVPEEGLFSRWKRLNDLEFSLKEKIKPHDIWFNTRGQRILDRAIGATSLPAVDIDVSMTVNHNVKPLLWVSPVERDPAKGIQVGDWLTLFNEAELLKEYNRIVSIIKEELQPICGDLDPIITEAGYGDKFKVEDADLKKNLLLKHSKSLIETPSAFLRVISPEAFAWSGDSENLSSENWERERYKLIDFLGLKPKLPLDILIGESYLRFSIIKEYYSFRRLQGPSVNLSSATKR